MFALSRSIRPLSRSFASDSAPKIKLYGITAVGHKAASVTTTGSGHTIRTDLPRMQGGDDSCAEPVYHMLAALVGCKTATASFVARHMKIEVTSMKFELHAERDQRGSLSLPIDELPPVQSGLTKIRGQVKVETSATNEQIAKLAEQVRIRCPVANTLEAAGAKFDIQWVKV